MVSHRLLRYHGVALAIARQFALGQPTNFAATGGPGWNASSLAALRNGVHVHGTVHVRTNVSKSAETAIAQPHRRHRRRGSRLQPAYLLNAAVSIVLVGVLLPPPPPPSGACARPAVLLVDGLQSPHRLKVAASRPSEESALRPRRLMQTASRPGTCLTITHQVSVAALRSRESIHPSSGHACKYCNFSPSSRLSTEIPPNLSADFLHPTCQPQLPSPRASFSPLLSPSLPPNCHRSGGTSSFTLSTAAAATSGRRCQLFACAPALPHARRPLM
ncbi:hypothetical protein RJ55_05570 [Drechmeria coniospora]|nr:hypothetical protein RJ55_05570 [Drechmeria coniospora]